ncbi:pickpocket protein 11 [Drosophila virilis]|uniref:Uncharacterized protein n=1 Tax=Drosophila virilis TaxID=7244 RepID=B4LQB6_DROVI|nr:pickpocket protein 11 [Drosophila virilis]EDW63366.1 uncharacterized protein Dvir_GJ14732 [Drosophila virilis]
MASAPTEAPTQPIYLINYENYLRPKQRHKITPLQCFDRPQKPKSRCNKLYKTFKRIKLFRWWRHQRAQVSKRLEQLPLPSFLSFLRARHDDGLCKTKTGFEIYCEMSSIHGFHIFVGAKTWQRVLWWLLICTALLLSLLVLTMSYSLSAETPTIRYIESMLQPMSAQPLPYPALSICSLNRVSRRQLLLKSKKWSVAPQTLQQVPWLTGRSLEQFNLTALNDLSYANVSWSQLLEQLAPRICKAQALGCQWQGLAQNCQQLLTTTWSYSEGRCCSFKQPPGSFPGNPAKGLTLRLASQLEDYASSRHAAAGFQLLIHEPHTVIHAATQRVLVPRGTEAQLMLKPYSTYATPYIGGLAPSKRGCYLSHERPLFYYSVYSQDNCLAECHSERMLQICGCVHPHMPRRWQWPLCKLEQFACLQEEVNSWDHMQSVCNCLPSCQFYRYEVHSDVATLDASYPMPQANDGFFKNFNGSDEVLLRIYFDSFSAERLRLDVYENWLNFIGTFGGITGLFMGCSFVSVFELIFFVCVRPTCNWLTRQQIRYRQRRRLLHQRRAANGN